MNGTLPRLEEVFKTSGVPTYTFVEPKKYPHILVSLRTPGRSLIVEGPSGIGKTTAIESALQAVGIGGKTTKLSARRPEDVEYIHNLPRMHHVGVVLVDDFHRLERNVQSELADYLKVLADTEDSGTKIIVLGINRAGDSLISFAPDLVNRIDVVRFETEPDEKIEELIQKGESAMNINANVTEEVTKEVRGSFYLAQMLCRELCTVGNILEASSKRADLTISFESVRAAVWERLGKVYRERCEDFCSGAKIRREGRAPYLHILHWLAMSDNWTLDLRRAMRHHNELRGSVGQVVDKGFLGNLIDSKPNIREVLHFDAASRLLTVEDPQFLFYIRNIPWRDFARNLGFLSVDFERRYDFALSFAGSDRDIASAIFEKLVQEELEVFYDKNEQHRILAQDVEEYLRPIYQTEAQFVVVLLGREYPKRIWTKIESDAFKDRFADGSVIPIWFTDVDEAMFDVSRGKGGLSFDRSKELETQVEYVCGTLVKKLAEAREANE